MGSTALSIEGALYELVARGNKDVYFFEDSPEAKFLYDNRYKPTPALIHELRRLPPLNSADFNRSSEFQLEIAGDIIIEPTILIDLPSWLPPHFAISNPNSICTDLSGVSYGYTNGIGFFLFERIQILQDNVLLQEFSGDALWATTRAKGNLNSAYLENRLTGIHTNTPLAIQRNATPGRLRLTLPLLGCQSLDDGGFPMLVLPSQAFKIRVFLRRLEDLVEASDGRPKPAPWGIPFQMKTSSTGSFTQFQTLERWQIGTPHLTLETRHIYIEGDTQKGLREKRLEIPFERLYENIFTQTIYDYAPITRGSVAAITRRLDGQHPTGRILVFFRSAKDIAANRLWKISRDLDTSASPPQGEYYNQMKLVIAGRDRETLFSPLVWHKLVDLAKEERDPGLNFAEMNWTLGDIVGRRAPFPRQPDGSINFTTADRPTLYIELADIENGEKSSEMRVIVDSWAVYFTENLRGSLLFAN
jgi:hypothetical protein